MPAVWFKQTLNRSSMVFAKLYLFITQINKTAPSDLWANFMAGRLHPPPKFLSSYCHWWLSTLYRAIMGIFFARGFVLLEVSSPIIIIMLGPLYCAAYTRMTMNESSPPCEQRRITFNDDGQRVQLARPELPAPHYICMYRLLPTTPPITV